MGPRAEVRSIAQASGERSAPQGANLVVVDRVTAPHQATGFLFEVLRCHDRNQSESVGISRDQSESVGIRRLE